MVMKEIIQIKRKKNQISKRKRKMMKNWKKIIKKYWRNQTKKKILLIKI